VNDRSAGWDITIRRGPGHPEARLTVRDGDVSVDPPDAATDPFVAAALAEIRRSLARPRARPACARDPRTHRPGPQA
jgi:hypothetical protein